MYDLKALQQKETEILQAVHDACEKLGIEYVIFYGTLLGAIRHGGFIPWDDDIDICMTRENYQRFLQEAQALLPKNLFIQHFTTEPGTNNLFIKVRDKTTLFLEEGSKDYDMCHGIFVDIFVMDRIPSNGFLQKCEYYRRKWFNIVAGCYGMTYIDSVVSPAKRFAGRIIHQLICSRKPISAFFKREDDRRKRMDRKGGEHIILHPFDWKGTVPIGSIQDRTLVKFEDREFYAPTDHDLILKKLYGDYMKLPPEDKRITHKPIKIYFNVEENTQ